MPMPSLVHFGRSLVGGFAMMLAAIPALVSGVAAESSLDAVINDLVAANRILYRQGVVDGFGHVTVRHPANPDRYLMSSSQAPGRVTKDDIMEFDLESRPIDLRGRTIYSERFIHSEIYKVRPDVHAVLHSHSPTVIPFGATNVPLRPIVNTAGFLSPDVPVFEMRRVAGSRSLLVTDAKLGKALAETLGNRTVALMRGHGNVVVGPNIRRMVSRAIYTEVNARLQLQALALGSQIIYLDEAEARAGEENRDKSERGHSTDRTWQMWVEEAMGPGSPGR
jgi:ribulose-5-phosphate 4-epimerase/fuculose-1-phosphate aldolase